MAKIDHKRLEHGPVDAASPGVDFGELMTLARLIRVDGATGAVRIANGPGCITLYPDGTVRIDAVRIVSNAGETITFCAPRIDLN